MPEKMELVLQLSQVTKVYRPVHRPAVTALAGVDLKLHCGELRVIAGPSGSGKSTLLMCAGGLLHPSSGQILLQGTDLYALNSEQRSRCCARRIGFVFQQFHLIPFLNILENILVGTLSGGGGSDLTRQAEMLLEQFGLSERRQHPVSELSVGERQRVALARALLFQPVLLLADEPTGNLDVDNSELVMRALREYANFGGAVLLVTHNRQLEDGHTLRLVKGAFVNEQTP